MVFQPRLFLELNPLLVPIVDLKMVVLFLPSRLSLLILELIQNRAGVGEAHKFLRQVLPRSVEAIVVVQR